METKAFEQMSNDELDAIATHAGALLVTLHNLNDRQLMPFFKVELSRIETEACEELIHRGVVAEFDDAG